jgi:hypothetical protein
MNKDKIYKILEARYGQESKEAIASVAADVYYSGEAEVALASSNVINKLFDRFTKRASIESTKSASVESNAFCPICKLGTQKIMLSDRPAVWCSRHFVVFPTKE